MSDAEPQCLHSIEVLRELAIDTESNQLIEMRHQHTRSIFADMKYLRRLGIHSLGKALRVEAVP